MSPSFSYSNKQTQRNPGWILRTWGIGILVGAVSLGALGLSISCGGSSVASPPPPATTGLVSGTVTNYVSGRGISGATVTDGTTTVTAFADGTYSMYVTPSNRKQISVTASNFAGTQKIITVNVGAANRADAALLPSTLSEIPDLTTGAIVTVPSSPAQVVLPPNALVSPGGGAPRFPVVASLTPVDPTSSPELMPGDYSTNTGEQIQSFGALEVTFRDSTGAKLNLASGQSAEIRIPLASAYWEGTPPATMPAYYFDEVAGRWINQGTLTLGGAGLDQYYEGTVAHFSYWNADQASTTVKITGTAVRRNGTTPVPNATVKCVGVDYIGSYTATADANGVFTLYAAANATSTITAVAVNSGGLPLASPTPDITITTTTTDIAIPAVSSNNNQAGKIIVDGYLNLTGTIRDFSPSAPYNFAPYAAAFTTSLTINGAFTADTNWTKGTGWTISGGAAHCAAHGTAVSDLKQNQACTNKVSYTVTYTVANCTAGTVTVILGGTSGTPRNSNGTFVETIVCGAGTDPRLVIRADIAFRGDIKNVSVVDPHPPVFFTNVSAPFPEYTGHPILGAYDGPWWNPDFEAEVHSAPGIVNVNLGTDNKPVYSGLAYGSSAVHSPASFNAWWNDFPSPHGTNDLTPYQGLLTIQLSEKTPLTNPPTYTYDKLQMFPNDGKYQGNYIYNNGGTRGTGAACSDGPDTTSPRNFHYTYEIHTTFTYKVGQVFIFSGDDDVWVFINKKLVMDLGGIHGSQSRTLTLNATATDTSGALLNLVDGLTYQFDFFYCERHTTQAHMQIETSITFPNTVPN